MHIFQHPFCLRQYVLRYTLPDLNVPGMAEETDADDDIPLQYQPFLYFKKCILEAGAAAEGKTLYLTTIFRLLSAF